MKRVSLRSSFFTEPFNERLAIRTTPITLRPDRSPQGSQVEIGKLLLRHQNPLFLIPPEAPTDFVAPLGVDNEFSLNFDGTDDFAALSTPLNILNNRTISLWIYVQSGGSAQTILGNRGDSPARGYRMRLNSDNRLFCFHTGVGNANITSTDPIPLQEWVHIAWVTAGANGAKLYVNFVEAASIAASDDAISSDQNFKFGEVYGGSGYFNGRMDEIQIWQKVLTLEEIEAAATVPLTGSEEDLAGYWRFEEGSGAVAADLTGNNDAAITGATFNASVPFVNTIAEGAWTAVAGVDGYNVYLSQDGAAFVKQNATVITTNAYNISIPQGGEYEAYVKAVDGELESEESNTVQIDFQVFYTDFSEYTTGVKPSDWTIRWDAATGTWTVVADAGATGGKVLSYNTQGSNAWRGLTWDDLDSVDDVVVEMRVKAYNASSGNDRSRQWILTRGVGATASRNTYIGGFDMITTGIGARQEVYRILSGSSTNLSEVAKTINTGAWWRLKFKVEGTDLHIKFWKDGEAEPSYTELSDSNITAAGWTGVAALLRGRVDIDWFKAIVL